jgi:hypothetical protein
MNLPSWVPNWAAWSSWDPEPFQDLTGKERRYWASGEDTAARIRNHPQSGPHVLGVRGVLFDYIQDVRAAWCPEGHLVPISRKGVTTLESWEELALKNMSNCPYLDRGGREEAFWRTEGPI